MTNISDWKAQGAFVDGTPTRKTIRYRLNGEEHEGTVFVRKLSIGDRERMYLEGQEEGRSRSAILISHCVRLGEAGEEALTFEQAYQLHERLAEALMQAIREVTGGDDDSPKS